MNALHSLENRARVLSAQCKLHLRSLRTRSLHCLSSGWIRAAGADDRPNSLKKRDEQERSISQRKRLTMNALHSLENRACVLSAQRISRVCHLVSQTLTWIGTLPKAFHNTHTSETKSPEEKKEDVVFHRCPFMLADAH